MSSAQVFLKLTGFSSPSKLEGDFASYLVDVAYIAELGEGFVLVAPDDAEHVRLEEPEDFEWFQRVVVESLRHAGEPNISATRCVSSSA